MTKRLLSCLGACLIFTAALAQSTLPPVPPIADAARTATYTIVASTTDIGVPFPIFGDCTDLQVLINGAVQPAAGPSSSWNCQSISGGYNLYTLPLPITDVEIVLNPPLTSGTVQINGDAHARRLSQPTAPGIARRDYNVDISALTVDVREVWNAFNAFIARPGQGFGDMISANNLSDVANAVASLANLGGAALNSPTFIGTPTAPTPVPGDNTGNLATTAFVQTAVGKTGAFTNLASATATDLGTVTTGNVTVTGTTTITGFGSSANLASPIYNLVFAGSLTLTYNSTSLILPGAKSIVTQAGDAAEAQYLGSGNWRVISYTATAGPPVFSVSTRCGASGLKIVNDTVNPLTAFDLTAALATLTDAQGRSVKASSLSLTVSALDTGSLSASTWYNLWVESNGSTAQGLLSLSASAPTLTSGYTYSCRLGAFHTNSSTQFLNILQLGSRQQVAVTSAGPIATLTTVTGGSSYTTGTYTAVPLTGGTGAGAQATVVVSGGAVTTVTITAGGAGYEVADSLSATAATIGGTGTGFSVPVATLTNPTAARPIMRQASEGSISTPTYVSFAITGYVPPTATHILGSLSVVAGGTAILAPDGNYGVYNSTTNPPPVGITNTYTSNLPFDLLIENQASPKLYWASSAANNAVIFGGFVDSVNAN